MKKGPDDGFGSFFYMKNKKALNKIRQLIRTKFKALNVKHVQINFHNSYFYLSNRRKSGLLRLKLIIKTAENQ